MAIPRRLVAFASAAAVGCTCSAVLARGREPRPRLRLDTDFAVRGVATFTGLGSPVDYFTAADTDRAGLHLYVAGFGTRPVVARFDYLGRPDDTFGNRGVAPLPLDGTVYRISAVDGIVAFGAFQAPEDSGIEGTVGAQRLLDDGSGLDTTFATGGMLALGAVDIGSGRAALVAAATDPRDGSYVAVVTQDSDQLASDSGL